MRTILILLALSACAEALAQDHDTIRTHWVYDTLDLYDRQIKDMSKSDTLTLVPIYGSWHQWCCWLPYQQHKGWVLGLHYDYANTFRIHSLGASVGWYFPRADMLLELEGQSNTAGDVFDLGISAWKNIMYIPVAKGNVHFPVLRPGIKLGYGNNYGNTYLYYEPKISITLPYGRSHIYYAHHQPMATDFVGGQIWHQFGWSYYFIL